MKLDFTPITEVLMTKSDTDRMLSLLTELMDSLYSLKAPLPQVLEETLPYSFKTALSLFFEKNKIDTTQKQHVHKVLDQLRSVIQKLPVLKIRMAFEPTSKQLKTFSSQLGVLTEVHIVLYPVIEPEIIGGAVIEHDGKIGDYSILKNLKC